jgi:hypothetical protein
VFSAIGLRCARGVVENVWGIWGKEIGASLGALSIS